MGVVTDVHIVGAGMTRFAKTDRTLRDLAQEAVIQALGDAGLQPADVPAAYVGNAAAGLVTGQEMIRGQVMLRGIGIEGIPIFNIENACASASSAAHLGWQAVANGVHDVVLCVGAEKLTHADKAVGMKAIGTAVDVEMMAELAAEMGTAEPAGERSFFMDIYADMARDYMATSGATVEHFASIVVKNQHNGARNARAQYGAELSVADVLASRTVVEPLTLLMCSPISDGAAAIVLASTAAMERLGRRGPRVRASVVVSGNIHDKSDPLAGSAGRAAQMAYNISGLGPDDLDCVEVHDASAPAEMIVYEQIALAPPGGAPDLVDSGRTLLDGDLPVNTSGGLLSKGHPIGATGIAQLCEATWQLRGEAGERQVEGARVALTQNGGGWLEGDSAAMAVHILSAD
ncbi:MAG TPA: thiolase family protein [Baekduia sp.]|uniref:thiolase family protein n=1 Tax=Baekduia sp. TaxID=2600305 RepID=UPI002C5153D8|nr:thiolase family protein [Baekduia sp.]HMJ33934.1 thiolase family protein [Baekduia sp.]